MQVLIFALIVLYALVMSILFSNWYALFQGDRNMSASQRQTARIVIMIATLLWPVVLPISYLELIKKLKRYEPQSYNNQSSFTSILDSY
jgi:hypothetical protein